MNHIKYVKTHKDAKKPESANATDAGFDISAALDEPVVIQPGCRATIDTGLRLDIALSNHMTLIPSVWVIDVRPRSGLAAKYGITVQNSPGTIDQAYTGPIKVILRNEGTEPFVVNSGDRIAQLLIHLAYKPYFIEADEVSKKSERNEAGFGSTGV